MCDGTAEAPQCLLIVFRVMRAVTYKYGVWAAWIKSGHDGGKFAEVEGDCRIYWTDGEDTRHHFNRRRHRKNRQKAFYELMLSTGDTGGVSDVAPTKIRFDPREDDSGEAAGGDDDLGTAWIYIEDNYTKWGKQEYDGKPLRKQINHRRKKFEFLFGYEMEPRIEF